MWSSVLPALAGSFRPVEGSCCGPFDNREVSPHPGTIERRPARRKERRRMTSPRTAAAGAGETPGKSSVRIGLALPHELTGDRRALVAAVAALRDTLRTRLAHI